MITLKSCPVCESDHIAEFRVVPGEKIVVEVLHGIKINALIVTRYCLCQDCRLIFQNPRLSDSELDIYYGSGYYRKTMVPLHFQKEWTKVNDVEVYPGIDQVPAKKFDLVSAIHVLEHVPYPLQFLKKMTKFVKKSGHLVIDVPSQETRGGPLGFPHLHYFETDVLRDMCTRVGLRAIYQESTPDLVLICAKNQK